MVAKSGPAKATERVQHIDHKNNLFQLSIGKLYQGQHFESSRTCVNEVLKNM